ncbi:MAG: GNAT family N-acetyltransferase [Nocardioides sp.]|nr:GNAT family N-acetyltransferase [Nocardioides sp.]
MTAPPTGALVVRRAAGPGELARVGALTEAAYEPFLLGRTDPYRERLRDAATRDREAEVLVAELDDVVVGGVTVCPPGSPWREIAADDAEGEFRMLAVDPTRQGAGVGGALVEAVLARFAADGARGVVLSSLRQMDGAHRLYERHGFVRAPERDWRPLPDVDLIAYVKDLP